MNFQDKLTECIILEAEKLAQRHHSYHNSLHIENLRKKDRISNPSNLKSILKPPQWSDNKKFNPFYVKKHAKSIAHSITKKIENGTYEPFTVSSNKIPKSSGGYRTVAIYQIPDAAVSTFFSAVYCQKTNIDSVPSLTRIVKTEMYILQYKTSQWNYHKAREFLLPSLIFQNSSI